MVICVRNDRSCQCKQSWLNTDTSSANPLSNGLLRLWYARGQLSIWDKASPPLSLEIWSTSWLLLCSKSLLIGNIFSTLRRQRYSLYFSTKHICSNRCWPINILEQTWTRTKTYIYSTSMEYQCGLNKWGGRGILPHVTLHTAVT